MKKNEFLCTHPLYHEGKWYWAGDKIVLEDKPRRAPIYFCLQPCVYKDVDYRAGEFGYFPDEIPPPDFFVHLHESDKYEVKYLPFCKKIYIRKKEK